MKPLIPRLEPLYLVQTLNAKAGIGSHYLDYPAGHCNVCRTKRPRRASVALAVTGWCIDVTPV